MMEGSYKSTYIAIANLGVEEQERKRMIWKECSR